VKTNTQIEEEIERLSTGICAFDPDYGPRSLERWRGYQPNHRKIRLFILSGVVPGMFQNEWEVSQMPVRGILESPRMSAALAAGWVQKFTEAVDKGNGALGCCFCCGG
jgi:hypothetical protein